MDKQFLKVLSISRAVGVITGKRPLGLSFLRDPLLQDRVKEIKDVDPVVELRLAIIPCLNRLEFPQ